MSRVEIITFPDPTLSSKEIGSTSKRQSRRNALHGVKIRQTVVIRTLAPNTWMLIRL